MMIWETAEDTVKEEDEDRKSWKLHLSIKHKEEMKDIFHKPMNLLISRYLILENLKKIKSVTYSSQGSHAGQLDFCNWQADDSTTG